MAKRTSGSVKRTGTDPKDEFAKAVAGLLDIIGGEPHLSEAEAKAQGYASIDTLVESDPSRRSRITMRHLCVAQYKKGVFERVMVGRDIWYRKARGGNP